MHVAIVPRYESAARSDGHGRAKKLHPELWYYRDRLQEINRSLAKSQLALYRRRLQAIRATQ
jgi:hypothetical protein